MSGNFLLADPWSTRTYLGIGNTPTGMVNGVMPLFGCPRVLAGRRWGINEPRGNQWGFASPSIEQDSAKAVSVAYTAFISLMTATVSCTADHAMIPDRHSSVAIHPLVVDGASRLYDPHSSTLQFILVVAERQQGD